MRCSSLEGACWKVVLIVAWCGVASAQTPPVADARGEAAAAAVLLDALVEQYRKSDHSAYDLDALDAKLRRDPLTVLAFVRRHIRSESYEGVLRGPLGTLVSRGGNSLERALLMEALLRRAGLKMRIAKGEGPSSTAAPGGPETTPIPAPDAASHDPGTTAADPMMELQRIVELKLSPDQAEQVLRSAEAGLSRRETLLRAVSEGTASDFEMLMDKVRPLIQPGAASDRPLPQHYWLQAFVEGQWIDLDPAGQPGASQATYVPSRLPQELYHYLTVRLVLEQKVGSTLSNRSILEHRVKTAELTGLRLDLSMVPLGDNPQKLPGGESSAENPKRNLQGVKAFQPVLMAGRKEIRGKPFDLQGNETRVAASSAGGGAAEKGRGTVSMFDELPGRPEAAPTSPEAQSAPQVEKPILTGLFLEVEWSGASAQTRSVRRDLLDRIGPAARDAGNIETLDEAWRDERRVLYRLLSSYQCLAAPGELSEGYGSYLAQRYFIERRTELKRLLLAPDRPSSIQPPETALAMVGMLGLRTTLLDAQFAAKLGGARLTHHQANFVCQQQIANLVNDQDIVFTAGIDIVDNRMEVATGEPASDWEARLFQGILDTQLEAHLPLTHEGRPTTVSVPEVFRRARAEDIETAVVTSADEASRLELPQDARARIAVDLEAGFVVIVPRKPVDVDSQPRVGWWRINRRTGETLGILDTGTGGESAEYYWLVNVTQVISTGLCIYQYRSTAGQTFCVLATGVGAFGTVRAGAALADLLFYAISLACAHLSNVFG